MICPNPNLQSDPCQRWESILQAIQHPAFELTAEEFAAIYTTFRQLRLQGVRFDPMLTALIAVLARQVADGSEDADRDDSDLWLDLDDVDEVDYTAVDPVEVHRAQMFRRAG